MAEDASFGQWLQQRRKALGLTQAALGADWRARCAVDLR